MGKSEARGKGLSQQDVEYQQSQIVTRLLHVAARMKHSDELFLWLAHICVQRLQLQVVQFWVKRVAFSEHGVLKLCTMVGRDSSLPPYVVTNQQVMEVARKALDKQQSYLPQSVQHVFPSYQANLLKRCGLNYHCSYYLSADKLGSFNDKRLTLLPVSAPEIVVLTFFEHPPQQKLLLALAHVLEQALVIARSRGLLPQVASQGEGPSLRTTDSILDVPSFPKPFRRPPSL